VACHPRRINLADSGVSDRAVSEPRAEIPSVSVGRMPAGVPDFRRCEGGHRLSRAPVHTRAIRLRVRPLERGRTESARRLSVRSIIPEECANVVSAALGHFVSQKRHCLCGLVQEILCRFHDETPRRLGPLGGDPQIDRGRLLDGLEAEWVFTIVGEGRRRRTQVDDGVIARQFNGTRRAHRREEVAFPNPLGRAINRSPVAKHHGGVVGLGDRLELALNVENRTLRRLTQRRAIAAREASAEDDSGGFRERLDVLAEEEPHQLQDRRFARPRAAREDDAPWPMAFTAVARFHDVSADQGRTCRIMIIIAPLVPTGEGLNAAYG
jgi:hypothetical protein